MAKHLAVPYFSQNDNKSGRGYRECFSSSCAMVAAYWDRVTGDDDYCRLRAKHGDSTDIRAQLETLQSLGLKAEHVTNGGPDLIRREIDSGRPIAVGWIHKGPVWSGLIGEGHWSVVVGYDDSYSVHNDPNGEADMLNGGYISHQNGRAIAYSWRNWRQRWEIERSTAGWRFAPGNGWAVLIRPR